MQWEGMPEVFVRQRLVLCTLSRGPCTVAQSKMMLIHVVGTCLQDHSVSASLCKNYST